MQASGQADVILLDFVKPFHGAPHDKRQRRQGSFSTSAQDKLNTTVSLSGQLKYWLQ